MPLYVLSSLSIIACIWGFRHDRSVEVSKYKIQTSSSGLLVYNNFFTFLFLFFSLHGLRGTQNPNICAIMFKGMALMQASQSEVDLEIKF